MARAALEWSQSNLAEAAGIARRTVASFELGGAVLPDKIEAMRGAFVAEGIAFSNGGKRAGVSYLRRES